MKECIFGAEGKTFLTEGEDIWILMVFWLLPHEIIAGEVF